MAAEQAYLDFISAYNDVRDNPPACDLTLTGALAGETLEPGVYCVDATAKTGTLILDAQGDANAVWTFLVDGALTGTGFNVVMINGGDPCDVYWWVEAAATLTDSNFLGTILGGGAAVSVTGGTFTGNVLATTAVTLTGATSVPIRMILSTRMHAAPLHAKVASMGSEDGPSTAAPAAPCSCVAGSRTRAATQGRRNRPN